MPIVSSVYSLGPIQIDGRRYCIETHTDHTGITHRIEYLASIGTDYIAVMTARAENLAIILAEIELKYAVFDGTWDYSLQWVTNNDLATWVRETYRNAEKDKLARIAKRILEWISNGRFTDVQVRTVFGLSAAQWTTLKTKMQDLAAKYDAIQLGVGE